MFGATTQTLLGRTHRDSDLEKRPVGLGYVIFAKVNNQEKFILALR